MATVSQSNVSQMLSFMYTCSLYMQPSHASKCKIWCIVSAAGVAVGLLIIIIIIILWILCRRSVQINIA